MSHAAGVSHKALIPIAGVAMLARVLRTLRATHCVSRVVVCGIQAEALAGVPELADRVADRSLTLIEGRPTPSASVLHALEQIPAPLPLLVTTADHPMLTPGMVEEFCGGAAAPDTDVALGLVSAARVRRAFPESKRTYLRFRDGAYCGCNLFAFLTPQGQRAAAAWREIEQHRKRPWRMVRALGFGVLLRFVLGRLALDEVVALASDKMDARVRAVLITDPKAAVDVDTAADLALVETLLRASGGGGNSAA
jgi:GTP:adenosylcobinamide-phosphate guanylyltransferase